MKYVVFYHRTYVDFKTGDKFEYADYKAFENEHLASVFATQYEGVVLIPAKVNLKIEKPKNV